MNREYPRTICTVLKQEANELNDSKNKFHSILFYESALGDARTIHGEKQFEIYKC